MGIDSNLKMNGNDFLIANAFHDMYFYTSFDSQFSFTESFSLIIFYPIKWVIPVSNLLDVGNSFYGKHYLVRY